MAKLETRVEKYKEYRDSMIKEGAIDLDNADNQKALHDPNNSTTALPLEQVMGVVESDQKELAYYKKKKIKKVLLILIPCLIGAAIVAGLIIFGIIVFGGK